MAWKTILTHDLKGLTEDQHISELKDVETFCDIYQGRHEPNAMNMTGITITDHMNDMPPLHGEYGHPITHAIHIGPHGQTWWELIDDFMSRRRLFLKYRIVNYEFGYLAGTRHPMSGAPMNRGMMSAGMIAGYDMWHKIHFVNENQ